MRSRRLLSLTSPRRARSLARTRRPYPLELRIASRPVDLFEVRAARCVPAASAAAAHRLGWGPREGGRAASHGSSDGVHAALDTSDGRYRRWFLLNRRRVEDELRFPRQRALAMDQGTSVYRLEVRRDGTLSGDPRLVRSSGFTDIDRAALAAIQAGTPFSPLPHDLAPQLHRVRLLLPIELSNPMVR